MSAPSGGASSAPQCACTNISIMQLFHELKQQFPGVPDHVVSNTISSHCHDRSACQLRLECEAKNYLSNLYPSSSLSTAKKEETKDISLPQHCPNQLSVQRDIDRVENIKVSPNSVEIPVKGFLHGTYQGQIKNHTFDKNDCNQNNLRVNSNVNRNNDLENTHEEIKEVSRNICYIKVDSANKCNLSELKNSHSCPLLTDIKAIESCSTCISESYAILKSNKVRSDLHRRLGGQVTRPVSQQCSPQKTGDSAEKPLPESVKLKRPNTLNLAAQPQLDGFEHKLNSKVPSPHTESNLNNNNQCYHLDDTEKESCNQHRCAGKKPSPGSQDTSRGAEVHRADDPYPLNVSVNLNCRMDVLGPGSRTRASQYSDSWRGDYSSPGNYTSVNLTVCTPTSSVHSAPNDNRYPSTPHEQFKINPDLRQRGFEGHVQITVSPASSHQMYPPPSGRLRYPPVVDTMTESAPTIPLDSLVRRQRARLERLQRALAAERARLAGMEREVRALASPLPPAADRLRPAVLRLRLLCQRLARLLDRAHATDEQFYDNIYTGQRPSAARARDHPEEVGHSWQCHVCTFRNHALLNKCEECGMPRIILGMPGFSTATAPPCDSVPTSLSTNNSADIENLTEDFNRQTLTKATVHASNPVETSV